MKNIKVLIALCIVVPALSCSKEPSNDLSWDQIKSDTYVEYNNQEFSAPSAQPLSTAGWEDGICISRDGLYLYCIYVPGDLLSWTINSSDTTGFDPYRRGPDFGMDLVTNPVGAASWVQADILYAQRSSITEIFSTWQLSDMARPVFSEGAPVAADVSVLNAGIFLFTSNDKTPSYDTDIWELKNTPRNPFGIGAPLAGFHHTIYTEDNPHIERINSSTLVIMFDSDNYPGGKGSHDIWYSVSSDNAASWSVPQNLTTVNTAEKEHQPHLYNDGTDWWLYYSAAHSDGKLGIFRSRLQTAGNWDSWGSRELVIGAGNSAGVGEPTLTSQGDISFVVVYENKGGGDFDRFDADPWFLPKKN